jgi:hypothetical protein
MSYRPGLPPVLKGITLEIEGGTKIGVVGRTGCVSEGAIASGWIDPRADAQTCLAERARVPSCRRCSDSSSSSSGPFPNDRATADSARPARVPSLLAG